MSEKLLTINNRCWRPVNPGEISVYTSHANRLATGQVFTAFVQFALDCMHLLPDNTFHEDVYDFHNPPMYHNILVSEFIVLDADLSVYDIPQVIWQHRHWLKENHIQRPLTQKFIFLCPSWEAKGTAKIREFMTDVPYAEFFLATDTQSVTDYIVSKLLETDAVARHARYIEDSVGEMAIKHPVVHNPYEHLSVSDLRRGTVGTAKSYDDGGISYEEQEELDSETIQEMSKQAAPLTMDGRDPIISKAVDRYMDSLNKKTETSKKGEPKKSSEEANKKRRHRGGRRHRKGKGTTPAVQHPTGVGANAHANMVRDLTLSKRCEKPKDSRSNNRHTKASPKKAKGNRG